MYRENAHKIVVLFSGGVESTCLLYLYLKKGWLVYPVYMRAGYPWEPVELENAKRLWQYAKRTYKNLMPIRILFYTNPEKVKSRSHSKDLLIPLRNLNLITPASNYALLKGIKSIAIGSLGIYPFYDNNLDYMRSLQRLTGIEILTPFMGMEKHQVIAKFSKDVPLERTLSCINPKRSKGKISPCGRCEKCKEREEAFKALSL
ncbi:MAG TPA: queuosine biosynthesis protein [Aquificaceae bacterium]|jgi:7-cyano-7-deazaguanine synthase|nr:MAG: 7-cyano-7-deazaguanine synthase [Aquificota bacterium]HCO39093.1 queuosine biosynthesis protein [Aquificaceae bacterium]